MKKEEINEGRRVVQNELMKEQKRAGMLHATV